MREKNECGNCGKPINPDYGTSVCLRCGDEKCVEFCIPGGTELPARIARKAMRDKATQQRHSHFYAGFAAAIASIVRQHDQPGIAADAISGYGIRLSDFKGVDSYDLKIIRKLYREESSLDGLR